MLLHGFASSQLMIQLGSRRTNSVWFPQDSLTYITVSVSIPLKMWGGQYVWNDDSTCRRGT